MVMEDTGKLRRHTAISRATTHTQLCKDIHLKNLQKNPSKEENNKYILNVS